MNNNPNCGNNRKEKQMNIITKTMSVAVLVALNLALTTWAAEPPKPATPPDGVLPPYGSAEFQASRQRPVGWRGNIQGTFIGATPPEAWNTSTTDIQYWGGKGNVTIPPGANVLWKVPMPNWASCGCIVVGKKVITRASPSTLLCYDADTGKRLWYNKTDIFDYHFKDDPKKAQEMRMLCQKWERQCFLGFGECGKGRVRAWTEEEKNEWLQLTKELIGTHPEWFGKTVEDPQWKALFERALGGWWPTEPKEIDAICGGETFSKSQRCDENPELFQALGFTANKYKNSEDPTISTPVSDGTYVYTASGHNLICCYELETGKLRWMTWTGRPRATASHGNDYWPSPWIFDGKLIIYNNYYLRALDLDTGKELWCFDFGSTILPGTNKPVLWNAKPSPHRSLSAVNTHQHAVNPAYLTVGNVPVVVTPDGHVVRASDGKVLAEGLFDMFLEYKCTSIPWDDVDDVVFWRKGAIRLTMDDQGKCSTTVLTNTPGSDRLTMYFDGRFYKSTGAILDAKTGTGLGSNGGVSAGTYQSVVLTAGPRLWALGGGLAPHPPKKPGPTQIIEPSEYGDAEIQVGKREKTRDPSYSGDGYIAYLDGKQFFKENPEAPVRTWARQALEEGVIGWLNAPPIDIAWMNNCYGAPPFCVGDRVYIRSRAYLYCFGPKQ